MIRFAAPFLFPIAIPILFFDFGPDAPLLAVATLAGVLMVAEMLAPRGEWRPARDDPRLFRALPCAYAPVQLALIGWASYAASRPNLSPLGFIGPALAVGVTTGIFGVLAAHELIHGKSRAEHALGALMLTGMSYRHFRIAHIYGHHRYAGTPRDPGTARLGESFYAFLVRTVAAQLGDAYAFERKRVGSSWLRNRVLQDGVVMAAVYAGLGVAWGWRAALFLVLQSAVAIIVLELFNYVAHYGLARRARGDQGLEPFADHHSWNCSNLVSNALLFNMGRHSDHHRHAASPYQDLRYAAGAPELPGGYVGAILLALAPPLWMRVMDPKVRALRADDLKAAA